MADRVTLAWQKALVAALRADAGVSALVGGRVYDEPPQSAQLPYVRLGNLSRAPLRTDCATDHVLTFSIEAHSQPTSGRVEATRIAEAVVDALDDAAVPVAGFALDWCYFVTQTVARGADGKTYVAVAAFDAALSA